MITNISDRKGNVFLSNNGIFLIEFTSYWSKKFPVSRLDGIFLLYATITCANFVTLVFFRYFVTILLFLIEYYL